ncbi:hypothetical protein DP59_3107 [Burkholderia pseudomallei]|nr:hypothetical protein DP59_3107 [Burkholderia pseudomallei]
MYEPESSRAASTTGQPPRRASVVLPATYTTRPAWTCKAESAWSRFAKFQMLNRLNWVQLCEALSVLPTVNAGAGIDLRTADSFDLADLATTLHVEPGDLEYSFSTASRQDALLDAASPFLRFCPICASAGFHATLFQLTAFKNCPIHGCSLCEACARCEQPLAYRLHAGLVRHPYACPVCGDSLLATRSLRRLQQQSAIDAVGLDRLRAWHDYYLQHARLLSAGDRRIRDAAGQYLSDESVQAHSNIPRRLAFIGDLPRYLHRPPDLPLVDPMPDATTELEASPVMPENQPMSCAWAAQWPHVDATCMMLSAVYRRLRGNRIRRLARSARPIWSEIDSGSRSTEHGLLLFDGSASPLSIALLGWRFSWERRFSIRTLVGCPKHYPPFGLLEWLAFMPLHLPPAGVFDHEEWLQHYFVHALEQTWNAWCTIAIGMRENGCYIVSPLLLPTRVLWLDLHDRGVDFSHIGENYPEQVGSKAVLQTPSIETQA